jgi:glycopeptide antibiotics resistance protein
MLKRLIFACIFVAYCALLVKLMVFKDIPVIRIGHLMFNFGGGGTTGPANLVPLKTIVSYLLGEKGRVIDFVELAGNIVPLMPIGFIAPLVYRTMTWQKALVLAVATGFVIEGMQVVLRVGIFDIDDVILNALGVMIGYSLLVILSRKRA